MRITLLVLGAMFLAVVFGMLVGGKAHAVMSERTVDCGTGSELVVHNGSAVSGSFYWNAAENFSCPGDGCVSPELAAFQTVTLHCRGLVRMSIDLSNFDWTVVPVEVGVDPQALATMLLIFAFVLGVATGGIRS